MKYFVKIEENKFKVVDENGRTYSEGTCLSGIIIEALLSLDESALVEADPDMKCSNNCDSCILFK